MTSSTRLVVLAGGAPLAAAVLVLLASGFARPARQLNVLLITLDTTRADRLSPYGLMDASMPHLERLAREGVVFDRAYSVAPLTLPAHATLLTGLLPPGHGVRDNADAALAETHTTLAELLGARGYRTGAFVGSVVLGADRGLAQGFDVYGGVEPRALLSQSLQRRGDAVVSDALDWLRTAGDSTFLLWTHLYDPHAPYDPPEPYGSTHVDPYVGEIMFADAQIGRLLDVLDRRRLTERTLVVVVGDHGEGLGEHGEATHGLFVYDAVLRVPLIVRAPAIKSRRVADLASLTDVLPTIVELLGLPTHSSDGWSLVPALRGEAGPARELYAESLYGLRFGGAPSLTLRDERYKLISGRRTELYDLARDPFETRNIAQERGSVADAMRRHLDAVAGRLPARADRAAPGAPSDLRERLAALGYTGHK
jgi:arylsulfatase A-like enzyme